MTDRTPASPVEVLARFAAEMARGVGVCERPHRNGEAHPHIHYDDRYIAKARQLSGIASALQAQDHTITKGGLDVELLATALSERATDGSKSSLIRYRKGGYRDLASDIKERYDSLAALSRRTGAHP